MFFIICWLLGLSLYVEPICAMDKNFRDQDCIVDMSWVNEEVELKLSDNDFSLDNENESFDELEFCVMRLDGNDDRFEQISQWAHEHTERINKIGTAVRYLINQNKLLSEDVQQIAKDVRLQQNVVIAMSTGVLALLLINQQQLGLLFP